MQLARLRNRTGVDLIDAVTDPPCDASNDLDAPDPIPYRPPDSRRDRLRSR